MYGGLGIGWKLMSTHCSPPIFPTTPRSTDAQVHIILKRFQSPCYQLLSFFRYLPYQQDQ
jgi:hypothetical protein